MNYTEVEEAVTKLANLYGVGYHEMALYLMAQGIEHGRITDDYRRSAVKRLIGRKLQAEADLDSLNTRITALNEDIGCEAELERVNQQIEKIHALGRQYDLDQDLRQTASEIEQIVTKIKEANEAH